ncbi:hypothetical protein [Chishuiella sp.]|uniref:hypothetical protein n=1 Tax=Chishuiella sp. TaxID=1969467 RepID=UPI0028A82CC8|nr:hypothetical protein [Chishuiella sp.]
MKSILSLILLATLSTSNAQDVSDYKYVIIPQEFPDFKKNDFNLPPRLKTFLRRKKYEIIVEDNGTSRPLELQNNPCLATKVDLQNVRSTFKNKLKVIFTDCNHSVIGEFEGVSSIKEFEKGYQEALQLAMNQVKTQSAKTTSVLLNSSANNQTILPQTNEVISNEKNNSYYKLDGKNYEVATTSNGNFVLINQENSQIVAQFYPSTQKNIYHVNIIAPEGNYQTIGYVNGNNIMIEYKTTTNSWELKTYTK